MYSQTATQVVRAPRAAVYSALVDADAVARWRVPDDMTAEVLEWEARPGGRFRVSLTYVGEQLGKTEGGTDTYSGRFADLVADAQVVEVLEFESADPALAGEMTMTTTLRDVDAGTEVELRHDGIPDAVRAEDNAAGTRMALANLAAYVEARAAG
ncbi:SRPBCC domain-containing protein [Nocardioides sp.]|uniref:SRPBCC domain-containing protein n=1 Tax=Nocardioides sp. TaxID=35761 RepID=UPI001A1C8BD6|nr:SRPBCC domain-containing protein [Nocardioides sp.]MBJ7357604.1 SRPBCC domain-containing protein [Nocardioides sp.]